MFELKNKLEADASDEISVFMSLCFAKAAGLSDWSQDEFDKGIRGFIAICNGVGFFRSNTQPDVMITINNKLNKMGIEKYFADSELELSQGVSINKNFKTEYYFDKDASPEWSAFLSRLLHMVASAVRVSKDKRYWFMKRFMLFSQGCGLFMVAQLEETTRELFHQKELGFEEFVCNKLDSYVAEAKAMESGQIGHA
jgi:hypothetical protein